MLLSVAVVVNFLSKFVILHWTRFSKRNTDAAAVDSEFVDQKNETENGYFLTSSGSTWNYNTSSSLETDFSSLLDYTILPPGQVFREESAEISIVKGYDAEGQLEGTRFDPPLYRQRYRQVADILQEEGIKTVVDLGCSEHKVIPVYKSVSTIESITGVDLDLESLRRNRYLHQPLITDYLIRRPRPLAIRLYQGDAGVYDNRLTGTEAVTLIEVIEHLYPDVLQQVSQNVFSALRPRLVVMTTPNSEYNAVFGDNTGFRHWDHKFEWTRAEFKQWCDIQASMYGYSVTFSGVGDPPTDKTHLGHCSQMAVFKITRDWSPATLAPGEGDMPYMLVEECIHPHQVDTYTTEESVAMDTKYYLHLLANQKQQEEEVEQDSACCYDYCTDELRVSPEYLLKFHGLKKQCPDVSTLTSILVQQGFKLTSDYSHVVFSLPQEESSECSSQEEDDVQYAGEEFQKKLDAQDDEKAGAMATDDWDS